MAIKVGAALKNSEGHLLAYTVQSTNSQCEEWCEANLACFSKIKELGAKVVQVEIRELDPESPCTGSAEAAAARVAKYLEERAKARQLDPEEIVGINVGSDREAHLLVEDLKVLTNYVKSMSVE